MEASQFSSSKSLTSRYIKQNFRKGTSSALSFYNKPNSSPVTTRHLRASFGCSNTLRSMIPQPPSLQRSNSTNFNTISHIPSRKSYKFTLIKQPQLDLRQRQKEISDFLSSANSFRKQSSANFIIKRGKIIESHTDNHESFKNRYNPSKHIFTHELIGQVPLPRKVVSLVRPESELDVLKQVSIEQPYHLKEIKIKTPIFEVFKKDSWPRMLDIKRRAMTAIRHMLVLKLKPGQILKLDSLIPKQPFGLAKSYKLLHACKEGNLIEVKKLLDENAWLVHSFDSSKQTGLHWAAKRNFCEIMKVMLSAGAWVDSRDLVGRSALFIATRAGFIEAIKLLLDNSASPFLKTYAGSSISTVSTNQKVKILIARAKIVINISATLCQDV